MQRATPARTGSKKRWSSLDAATQDSARSEQVADRKQVTEFMRSSINSEAFKGSFGAFDLLWAFLALGSAFKIGCGMGGGDD